MFPIRDDNPTLHPSIVAYAIIILNVASWILIQGLGTNPQLIRSVFEFGVIPGELLGLVPEGTRVPVGPGLQYVVEGAPNYLAVITHMFMHGGWLHIIGNMWFLYVFGDNVEDSMGSMRFALFYLACGLAALGLQMATHPGSAVPMVGASGAKSGVMGAYIIMFPRAPVNMLVFLGSSHPHRGAAFFIWATGFSSSSRAAFSPGGPRRGSLRAHVAAFGRHAQAKPF
jgi:membrane associated rhomboid family serine protease